MGSYSRLNCANDPLAFAVRRRALSGFTTTARLYSPTYLQSADMKCFRLHAAWLLLAAILGGVVGAQPVITPDRSVMAIDDIGVYTVGYAYRGQAEQLFPLGWSGFFEDRTGVAC